ncbi:hypothetical protein [Nonomuraea sp. NPDC023979]|uniref:hypothetical protein n=1 Tax=Nonomuraea sp. NPDC023979 TaxID=3154796 RepID=UPI0034113E49
MIDLPQAAVHAAAEYLRADEVDRGGADDVEPVQEFYADAREMLKPVAPVLMAEGMRAFAAYLEAHTMLAPVPSSVYAQLAREHAERMEAGEGEEGDDCFTAAELAALDLVARLSEKLGQVIGNGPDHDANELLAHLHAVQHALMAQATARLYPERFRLLGGVVDA